MTRSDVAALLDPYDGLPLECDGLTRVLQHVLSRHGVSHRVFLGVAALADAAIVTHFWIRLDGPLVADYRLRMWLGPDAPHGVFNARRARVRYEGQVVDLTTTPFLFALLTSQHGGLR